MPSPNRDDKSYITNTYVAKNNITGAISSTVTEGQSLRRRDMLVTSSVRTPNFRNRKKSSLPINPYSKSSQTYDDYLDYHIDFRGPGTSSTGTWKRSCVKEAAIDLAPGPSADDCSPQLSQQILAAINQSKTNAMVGAAEFNKTADMVAHTATRIYRSIKALRRGDFKTFVGEIGVRWLPRDQRRFSRGWARANHPNNTPERRRANVKQFTAQTWLEYQYGWKPLLADVYSHMEALAQQHTKRSDIVRRCCRKGGNERVTQHRQVVSNMLICDKTTVSKVEVAMGVWYSIPNGGVPTFHAFGISNPMEVAWELVPFSFVADWFLPVGDYLRSLTATIGLEYKWGYKTVKTTTTVKLELSATGAVIGAGTPNTMQFFLDAGMYSKKDFSITRTQLTSFPTPQLPQFKDPRSLTHCASAIALLTSLFLH